jgi:hypothetical protein
MLPQFIPALVVLAFLVLRCSPGLAQTATQIDPSQPQSIQAAAFASPQAPTPQPGSIGGTVVDQSGAIVAGAEVTLTRDNPSISEQATTGTDGQFLFVNIAPGPFRLAVTSAGFAAQTAAGNLRSGEIATVPEIVLMVAENVTEVRVGGSQVEVAAEQIKVEEKQRVLGAIPNFYVSYDPQAVSLDPKQKFQLAWKSIIDPFTFVVVGGTAGVQQAQDHFREYGQGSEGYAKRFGAVYADTVTSTFIGGAIFPSLLKQDPRYFYKGTGSRTSRALYAIAFAVRCKGDNGRWQLNYSGIMGSMAAAGISNLYYPPQDRDGFGLTVDNTAIGIGQSAITNLLQEFLIRKLTPKAPKNDPSKP